MAGADEPTPQEQPASETPASETSTANAGFGLATIPVVKWDPQQLKEFIERWLEVWENPPADPGVQAQAIAMLSGYPDPFPAYDQPPWLKKRLVGRRLSYRSPEARHTATLCLAEFVLRDEPEKLVPILRDALNDPDPEIRFQVVHELQSLKFTVHDKLKDTKNAAQRQKWINLRDEIVDMIIDKGLADEKENWEWDAVSQSMDILGDLHKSWAPTPANLRSLDRRIARGLPDDDFSATLTFAKKLRGKWARIQKEEQPPKRAADFDGRLWVWVPTLRDALNDPDANVRQYAIHNMGTVLDIVHRKLDVVFTAGTFFAYVKPHERRKWLDLHDAVVDMLIDKGLGDEAEDVATRAMAVLERIDTFDATSADLRSLERRIARGVPIPDALKFAKELRAKWTRTEKRKETEEEKQPSTGKAPAGVEPPRSFFDPKPPNPPRAAPAKEIDPFGPADQEPIVPDP